MPAELQYPALFHWLRITAWSAAVFFAIGYGSRGLAALTRGWGALQLAQRQSTLFVLAAASHTAHAALLVWLAIITRGEYYLAHPPLRLAVVLVGGSVAYAALYLVTLESLGFLHPALKLYRAASFYIWAAFTLTTLLGTTRYHFIAPIPALLIFAGYCRLILGRRRATSLIAATTPPE